MAEELSVNMKLKDIVALGNQVEVAAQQALARAQAEFEPDARARCPVKTGRLRDSIGGEIVGTVLTERATESYAGFVEYGTRHMPARPFFTPATDQVKSKLPEFLQTAVREALERSR